MDETSEGAAWTGRPERLEDGFVLTKVKGDGTASAVCTVFTHARGWELRLVIENHAWQATGVFRSTDEMRKTLEFWRASLLKRGWA